MPGELLTAMVILLLDDSQACSPKPGSDICKTVSGARVGQECLFPFTYEGEEYKECITLDDTSPWCSVKLDENQTFINPEWGSCDKACPGGEKATSGVSSGTT